MTLEGEYEPNKLEWVRTQVDRIELSGGTEGMVLEENGWRVILLTTRGASTGKIRKTPVMRVEHDGEFLAVASMGGAPKHPSWYFNLTADPEALEVRDGTDVFDAVAREISGAERDQWWERAVAVYPPYAEYQEKTDRVIPLFVISRR